MTGVNILQSIPIKEINVLLYFFVTFSILFIGSIISLILFQKQYYKKSTDVILGSFFLSIIVAMLIATGIIPYTHKETGEYKYKIQITDECKFNEFNSKYEILEEKENNIYMVKEKTTEK